MQPSVFVDFFHRLGDARDVSLAVLVAHIKVSVPHTVHDSVRVTVHTLTDEVITHTDYVTAQDELCLFIGLTVDHLREVMRMAFSPAPMGSGTETPAL